MDEIKDHAKMKELAFGYVQNFIEEADDLLNVLESDDIDELKSRVMDIKELRSTMVRHLIIKNILCK